MRYLAWAVLALLSYSFVAPLVSLGTRDVPSDVAVVVVNGVLVATAVVLVYATGKSVGPWLTHPSARYLFAAGVFLTVGILAYYRALSLGPVSVVVPIFGLFIATSSVVGIVALEEPLTARKALGIGFAILAVVLTSLE